MRMILKIFLLALFVAWFAGNILAAAAFRNFGVSLGMFLLSTLWFYGLAVAVLTAAVFLRPKMPRYTMRGGHRSETPGVSVIIPFRNEERNLEALLRSLKGQSYRGAMEVIMVDDGSEDNGVGLIKKFLDENDDIDIKIIHSGHAEVLANSQYGASSNLTGKQRALDLGVSQSSYPLAAFTDADMILEPNWIESLVDTHLAADADIVFGYTSIIKSPKLLARLESFQLDFLFSFAYAFSKLGLPGSCMGNNILVVKERYEECGGQRGIGRSIVEDRALLESFRKRKFKTAAAEPFYVTAKTYPAQTRRQFLNQMWRWARGGLPPGGGLFAAAILFLTQNAVFFLAATGVISGGIAAHTFGNFLMTWLFVFVTFRQNRSPSPKLAFPLYYAVMMIETFVVGWMALFRAKIDWKGRELS